MIIAISEDKRNRSGYWSLTTSFFSYKQTGRNFSQYPWYCLFPEWTSWGRGRISAAMRSSAKKRKLWLNEFRFLCGRLSSFPAKVQPNNMLIRCSRAGGRELPGPESGFPVPKEVSSLFGLSRCSACCFSFFYSRWHLAAILGGLFD